MKTPISPDAIFQDAARDWLEGHIKYIAKRTIQDYRQYIIALTPVFGGLRLNEITIQAIRTYQDTRSAKAGASRINMELSTLQQILKDAGLWANLQPLYRTLPTPRRGSGYALTPEEEKQLLEIAFASRRRLLAAHCLRLMLKTACGFGEIRHLRRRDVDLDKKTIQIEKGAKNEFRARTVPLIPEALESMQWIIDRWDALGGRRPDDFILPHCSSQKNGPRDFSRPMLSLKKAWEGIRREAVKQIGPHLAKLRVYDTRPTAITRLLSDGRVSLHAAQSVVGHVSQAMQRRYYRPGEDILRAALSVLSDSPEPPAVEAKPIAPAAVPPIIQDGESAQLMRSVAALVRDTGITVDLAIEIVTKTRTQTAREAAFTVAEKVNSTLKDIPRKAAAAVAVFVAPKKVSTEG
jgi:integrase